MQKISRWSLAKMAAVIANDEKHDQKMVDAKIEVDNFCNDTDNNFIVEKCKKPSFWRMLKTYLTMKVT